MKVYLLESADLTLPGWIVFSLGTASPPIPHVRVEERKRISAASFWELVLATGPTSRLDLLFSKVTCAVQHKLTLSCVAVVSGDGGVVVPRQHQDAAVGHHHLHTDTFSPISSSSRSTWASSYLPGPPLNVSCTPGRLWGWMWCSPSPAAAAGARWNSHLWPGHKQQLDDWELLSCGTRSNSG